MELRETVHTKMTVLLIKEWDVFQSVLRNGLRSGGRSMNSLKAREDK